MEPKRQGDLRVVLVNLFGRRANWPARREAFRSGLAELQPDVIAFLEAIKTPEYDQVHDILGPDFQLLHQKEREPGEPPDVEPGQGYTIASTSPMRCLGEIDLQVTERSRNFACGAILAEIDGPVGPMLFVLHLPNWEPPLEYERELQAVRLATEIERVRPDPDAPVVIATDLDADPAAASTRFWTGRQSLQNTSVCYRDAWESAHPDLPGHTFTPDNPLMKDRDWPFRRIDYIFVRCGLHGGPSLGIRQCEIVFDAPVAGAWASDHYGLLADLTR